MEQLPEQLQFLPRAGLSIIEVLISVTVAGLLVLGASQLFDISIRTSSQTRGGQTASFLAQEEMEYLTSYADAKWYCQRDSSFTDGRCQNVASCQGVGNKCGLYNLNKGSGNRYYIVPSTTPLTWASPQEEIIIDGQAYSRSFYIENVCRGASGNFYVMPGGGCNSGDLEDLSVQRATVVINWTRGTVFEQRLVRFLARTRSDVIGQTDWSGGSFSDCNSLELFSANASKFACDTPTASIDSTSIPGSIKIN